MRKKYYVYILLFLTATAFSAVNPNPLFLAADKEDATPEENSNITLSGKEVVDLRNTSNYNIAAIERRPLTCHNKYNPWDPISKLNCTYVEYNLSSVSLVADSANYIDKPLGKQNYNSKYYSTEESPWDLEFLPNGSRIISYRGGKVEIQSNHQEYQVGKFDVVTKYENGLLGLAVDPNFSENRFIYLYYTYKKAEKNSKNAFGSFPVKNRISRFRLEENLTEEKILINKIPGSKFHSGGRLEFGPDGKLYATTGEAGAAISGKINKPQNIGFLGGKVLRINKEGSLPVDNPFKNSYVYSRGHRNPQGLAWSPENGNLYATEHGDWREDEINHVVPGGNYGYASMACGKEHYGTYSKEVRPPVKCYDNWTMAPSGATFVHDESSPWYGDMFIAGLRGKHIARLSIENNTINSEKVFYFSKTSHISQRLRDVEYFNGSLWIIGDSKGMAKLTPHSKPDKLDLLNTIL
jgi:glucose/arabinose dehydrogenase